MEHADSNNVSQTVPLIHLSLVGLLFLSNSLSLQAKIDTTGNRETSMPRVTGQLTVTTEFYHTNDSLSRYVPVSWAAYGNFALETGSWTIPINFVLSEKERSSRQAFNQVGLSPKWRWLTLHAGYRNVFFSNFTLSGLTMLGGGVEMQPGKLRFGAVYGRLQREVKADTTDGHGTYPAHERWGYAIKAGVGNPLNFFDLIFFHGRDKDGPALTYGTTTLTPAENDVGGFNARYSILKNLVFEAESGFSLYTRDVNDTGTNDDISGLPFTTNHGTQTLAALRTALAYTARRWSAVATYKRIEPDYRSMGAWYFQNDVEQFTLSPRLWFPKKNIRLGGAIGVERNNLFNIRATSARRIIGNLRASWQVTPSYGLDVEYANFGMTERNKKATVDSVHVAQVQQMASCSHRYIIYKAGKTQTFWGNFLYQRLNYKEATAAYAGSRYYYATLGYVLGLNETRLTLNSNLGYSSSMTNEVQTGTLNLNLGAQKSLYEEKIQTGISTNWQPSYRAGARTGSFFMANMFASYHGWQKHTFSIDLSYQNSHNNSPAALLKDAEEWRGIVSYQFFL